MIPFDRGHSTHLRVACQIIHHEREADGTLIDLVTLEPNTFACGLQVAGIRLVGPRGVGTSAPPPNRRRPIWTSTDPSALTL
jgi:hypothetical protein